MTAIRRQVDDLTGKVGQLFLLTMSPAMYQNLKKLASGQFGPYEMNGGFQRELFHLRDVGYIDAMYLSSIPHSGPDLSRAVRVTDAGLRFVALREQLDTLSYADG